MTAIILHLPLPPSANGLTFNAGKFRKKTDVYKQWLSDAGALANSQRKGKRVTEAEWSMEIQAFRKNKRRDLDNILKPTADLLVKMGITPDDRHMRSVSARWVDAPVDDPLQAMRVHVFGHGASE